MVTESSRVASISGVVRNDGVELVSALFADGRTPTDVDGAGATVDVLAVDGSTVETVSVPTAYRTGHGPPAEGQFVADVPFPAGAVALRIDAETPDGTAVTDTVSPVVRAVRERVGSVPDRAVDGDPGAFRDRTTAALDEVERLLEAGKGRQATARLREVRESVAGAVADYEVDAFGQLPRARLVGSLDDRVADLEAATDPGAVDEYATFYREDALEREGRVVAEVTAQEDTGPGARAGVLVRNDATGAGEAGGYVVCAVAPGAGFQLGYDADGDGYLNTVATAGEATYPCRVRLDREGTTFTAAYSADGEEWTTIGSATVSDAADRQDAGMFATAGDPDATSRAEFGEFAVEGE